MVAGADAEIGGLEVVQPETARRLISIFGISFRIMIGLCVLEAERPKLGDPAHEGVGLQPGRDGRVRCSAWLGDLDIMEITS